MRLFSLTVTLLASFLVSAAAFAADIEVKMLNKGEEGKMIFEPSFIKALLMALPTIPEEPAIKILSCIEILLLILLLTNLIEINLQNYIYFFSSNSSVLRLHEHMQWRVIS